MLTDMENFLLLHEVSLGVGSNLTGPKISRATKIHLQVMYRFILEKKKERREHKPPLSVNKTMAASLARARYSSPIP